MKKIGTDTGFDVAGPLAAVVVAMFTIAIWVTVWVLGLLFRGITIGVAYAVEASQRSKRHSAGSRQRSSAEPVTGGVNWLLSVIGLSGRKK